MGRLKTAALVVAGTGWLSIAGGCGAEPSPFVCPVVAPGGSDLGPAEGSTQDIYAEIADLVPGFAGMYVEVPSRPNGAQAPPEEVTLVILLVDVDPALGARARAEYFAAVPDSPLEAARVELRSARYDFRQLTTWYELSTGVWGVEGILESRIDERDNVISYGVVDAEVAGCVESNLLRLGVPADGLRVEVTEPTLPL